MLNRLPDAEQELARLDSLCLFGCSEHRQLKAAIANYKQGRRRRLKDGSPQLGHRVCPMKYAPS